MSSQHITQTAVTARRPSAALRKAVEAYRTEHKCMETWARELLERLARSDDAAKAFERLKLKDGRERQFLMLCILVAQLAREFSKRISTQQKMVKRLNPDKAITALRSFVKEYVLSRSNLLIPQFDGGDDARARVDRQPFPVWGFFQPPDDAVAMMRGLELIAEAVKKQKTVMAKLGATRNKNIEEAPHLAAIGHLKEGVRELTGKPHKSQIRKFVPAIFGRELSDESVTYALRARKKRVRG
jgi:hypothetical protein